ncbi:hypothetical protein FE257_000645 [Aspergillus nanangensis]|uniref:Uncharacterized protein n=1 Tax=Aspergillus nanangensis TaxID=2582783 RepID=A0AAD4GPF9_ASPNN|nr:hypothetical protein FE257_000645 [Aspergillus nanangensis]
MEFLYSDPIDPKAVAESCGRAPPVTKSQQDISIPRKMDTEKAPPTGVESGKMIMSRPIEYLHTLPSKNVRGLLADALSSWFKLSRETVDCIERIISHLHSASLLIDDIEDGSGLRRGKPVAHHIFGSAQTYNSASYLFVMAVDEAFQLNQPESHGHFLETGGLFCMLGRLLYAESEKPNSFSLEHLCEFLIVLGQFFQIRDDHMNLVSAQYKDQKGFAEDLDEGKYSFPLIHFLENTPGRMMIESIMHQWHRQGM